MKYPEFFNSVETITLQDKLSQTLGTFEDGIIEFNYLDVVKSAGHSCPTVSGAYLSLLVGLKELYQDELPQRGEIYVSFPNDSKEGVAGVIAAVATQITGATETLGFKGLGGGKFARHSLMSFNANIKGTMQLKRTDTNQTVDIKYDPSGIEGDSFNEKVENIFKNITKVITIL
jgi:hypothetical protein